MELSQVPPIDLIDLRRLPVSALVAIGDLLGLSTDELLSATATVEESAHPEADDVARLGAVLTRQKRISRDLAMEALDWSAAHLAQVIEELTAILAPAGMTIMVTDAHLGLAPAVAPPATYRQRYQAAAKRRRTLSAREARELLTVVRADFTRDLPREQQYLYTWYDLDPDPEPDREYTDYLQDVGLLIATGEGVLGGRAHPDLLFALGLASTPENDPMPTASSDLERNSG